MHETTNTVCPLLVRERTDGESYIGYIEVQGQEFRIRIQNDDKDNMNKAQLYGCPRLKKLLGGFEAVLQQRLTQSIDVTSFVVELKDLLERIIRTGGDGVHIPGADFYARLVSDMDAIGWEHLVSMDASLTNLHLSLQDSSGRRHVVSVKLPPDYPASAPQCSAALPSAVVLNWRKGSTLANLVQQYQEAFARYQDMWEVLDDIDQNTWVLEPEHPTPATTLRRIALGGHCSLQVVIDPKNPRNVPEIRFLGAESVVGPMRSTLNMNLNKWDHNAILRHNLQNILSFQFPSPVTSKKEDFSVECGICYAYRLDQSVPDRVCENSKCARSFHQRCLYEWLRALPDSRQSFDTIFGNCPYCSEPISTKAK